MIAGRARMHFSGELCGWNSRSELCGRPRTKIVVWGLATLAGKNTDADMRSSTLRRAVTFVALANLAYFGVEFTVALAIGSVSLSQIGSIFGGHRSQTP